MVAGTEFILVRDGVHHAIHLIDIRADAHGFLFNPRIDLRNQHNGRTDGTCRVTNFAHEVRERVDSKIDPSAKFRVGKIAKFEIVMGIQARAFFEGCHSVVIEARPSVFPAVEMRHPVGDVHVNPVDSCRGDLTDSLHIKFPPLRRQRTDPNIFITRSDPESRARTENGRLTLDIALQPAGMVF